MQYIQPFAVAALLGALIGMERAFSARGNRAEREILGGLRTFSLISLMGCIASLIDTRVPGFLVAALAGVIAMAAIAYFISNWRDGETGVTTEIAIPLCFCVGVLVQADRLIAAVIAAVMTAIILHLKQATDSLAGRLEKEDIRAVLKFVIVAFVILPLLDPDYVLRAGDIAPLAGAIPERFLDMPVVKPYTVWLMVVLISAISFAGYVATKVAGPRRGIGVTGFLGGLVSSTATTITFARRSAEAPSHALPFSLAIIAAGTIMYPRILVETAVVNAALVPGLAVSLGAMTAVGAMACLVLWRLSGRETAEGVPLRNPFSIAPALSFALVYAAIVLAARVVQATLGDAGVYVVSIISGLSDVDAITLTMSQLAREDPSRSAQSITAITLAAMANTGMKAFLALAMGTRRLKMTVVLCFVLMIAAGVISLVLAAPSR